MGANTYRVLAEVAASGSDANGSATTELPKVVFSRSLQAQLTWANTKLVAKDVATAVPAMKRQPGDLLRAQAQPIVGAQTPQPNVRGARRRPTR